MNPAFTFFNAAMKTYLFTNFLKAILSYRFITFERIYYHLSYKTSFNICYLLSLSTKWIIFLLDYVANIDCFRGFVIPGSRLCSLEAKETMEDFYTKANIEKGGLDDALNAEIRCL